MSEKPTPPMPEVIRVQNTQNRAVYALGMLGSYAAFRGGKKTINRPQIRGTERVQRGSQEIWVGSHRKEEDIPLSALMVWKSRGNPYLTGPAKKEYWYTDVGPVKAGPVTVVPAINVGRAMERMGSYPLNRGGPKDRTNTASMKTAADYVDAGLPAFWFPEGHRYDITNHEIQPVSPGVVRLSQRTGVGMRAGAIAYDRADNGRLDVAMAIGEFIPAPEDKDEIPLVVDVMRTAIQAAYNDALEMLDIEPTTVPGEWSSLPETPEETIQ